MNIFLKAQQCPIIAKNFLNILYIKFILSNYKWSMTVLFLFNPISGYGYRDTTEQLANNFFGCHKYFGRNGQADLFRGFEIHC